MSTDWQQRLHELLEKWSSKQTNVSTPQAVSQTSEAFIPPVDTWIVHLIPHPCVVLTLGHCGGGKSALCCRIQELKRDVAPPYAVGLPTWGARLLPSWYGLADTPTDIPPNAVIYFPESYCLYQARSSQSAQGRGVGDLVNLSRHRRHTIIFDVQNPAHLDRNIISEADVILVKEPGPFTQGFERPQLRLILDAARAAFAAVGSSRRKRAVWVVAPASGVHGQFRENLLPTFWSDPLSRVFGEAMPKNAPGLPGRLGAGMEATPVSTMAPTRPGKRTLGADKPGRARQLRAAGYSYTEIGKMLGVGKSQAYRLVNGHSRQERTFCSWPIGKFTYAEPILSTDARGWGARRGGTMSTGAGPTPMLALVGVPGGVGCYTPS